jgi:hypothetical protein
MESPIVMPAASPMRPGRYSCPITTVIPKVPTVAAPTSTSNAMPRKGPANVKQKTRGGNTSIDATSIVRLPNLSARGPIVRVPAAPPKSISVRAVFPIAGDTSSTRS